MAGVVTAITPSGNLNPGNQSINGQREDANGFLVNGSDVKEEMNGGTAIIPDLDSISEFRVLTNNFDPEYGNYAGGIVNAVTKSGTNQFHGDAFEFLRNTDPRCEGFLFPAYGTPMTKINSAARSAARSKKTRSSFLETIKERGRTKAWIPGK